MNATIIALLGYLGWNLSLVILLAAYRSVLVMQKNRAANEFSADGSDSPPFGQRLNRAYTNTAESFAFVGGTLLAALATNSAAITNDLAFIVLGARIAQSVTHLLSTSVLAVQIRFAFFVVQVLICCYWLCLMALKFAG